MFPAGKSTLFPLVICTDPLDAVVLAPVFNEIDPVPTPLPD